MIRKLVLFLVSLILICAVAVASYASTPGILGSGPALAASSSTQIMTSSLPVAVVEFGVNVLYVGQYVANSSLYPRPPTEEISFLASVPCVNKEYASFSPTTDSAEMTAIITCNAISGRAVSDTVAQTGVTKSKFASVLLVVSPFYDAYSDNVCGSTGCTTLKTHSGCGPVIGLVAA